FRQRQQKGLLLFFSAVHVNGVHRPHRQARVHAPHPVGGADHFRFNNAQRQRQPLATVFHRRRHALPAAFHILLVGFFKAFRRGHLTVIPHTAFITTLIQRCQHFFAETGGFAQNGIDHLRRGITATRNMLIVVL